MSDKSISREILKIRARAGNDNTSCPLCTHAPENPFRRTHKGEIIMGCIDAIHTGKLTLKEDIVWHNRTAARNLRKRELEGLKQTVR